MDWNILKLGMVYEHRSEKNWVLRNHRSLLKVILNPFLRITGLYINSLYDSNKDKIVGLRIDRCKPCINFKDSWWGYVPDFKYRIELDRWVF